MSRLITAAVLAVLVACDPTPPPIPHTPDDPPGYTCETAHDRLEELGGCGAALSRFVSDCHAAEDVEAADGVRLPVGCLSVARTCDDAAACR